MVKARPGEKNGGKKPPHDILSPGFIARALSVTFLAQPTPYCMQI